LCCREGKEVFKEGKEFFREGKEIAAPILVISDEKVPKPRVDDNVVT
jgi:hypothetical protein